MEVKVMKRLFTIGTFLFLLVMLAACTQYDAMANEPDVVVPYEEEGRSSYEQEDYPYKEKHEGCHHFHEQEDTAGIVASWAVDEINFSSVEDFLNAYMTASRGGEIDSLASEWHVPFTGEEDLTFSESAANVNFTSLEHFYLPVGIPDEFELFTITVNEGAVNFIFMRPEDMVSEDAVWDALWNERVVRFDFPRWDMDDAFLLEAMLEQGNITEEDLVNGRYEIREHEWAYVIAWVYDRTRFWLQIPRRQHNARGESVMATELDGVSLDDPYELVSFAETTTINLQDTRAVEAMIAELEAAR